MYLWGEISVDPSQLTNIEKKPPTNAFAKMAHVLSVGLVSDKEEQETFCAVAILQQLNVAMRSIGLDNIVQLSKDDAVFYEDREGRTGDLKQAMDHITEKLSTADKRLFDKLHLVLEHQGKGILYLIGIEVNRTHNMGEFPIVISVSGLLDQFAIKESENEDDVKKRLDALFKQRKTRAGEEESQAAVQERYAGLLNDSHKAFNKFLDKIANGIKKTMAVDDVAKTSAVSIVRPRKRISTMGDVPTNRDADLVYRGYAGIDDAFFYAWLWADMCYSSNIHCSNVSIVDEHGKEVLEIGDVGINANDSSILDTRTEQIVIPDGADVEAFGNNQFESQLVALPPEPAPTTSESSGSWFGGFFDGMGGGCGGDGGGGDGGGGGSCGGGCGGCGGG